MAWLKLNGIETRALVAIDGDPKGTRRDVGAQSDATDGSLVLTRQVRKHDFSFTTVPLSGDEAFAWESLLVGEGHVWHFDAAGVYSNKGLGGALSGGAILTASHKYGSGSVSLEGEFGKFTVVLPWTAKTVAAWRAGAGGVGWQHLVWLPDANLFWIDGVADNPANATDYFGRTGAQVECKTIDDDGYFDDFVVCPYEWLPDWPAQVHAAGYAFGAAFGPYLTAEGDLVPETTVREMACVKCDERVMVANLGAGMERDVRVLTVELKGR